MKRRKLTENSIAWCMFSSTASMRIASSIFFCACVYISSRQSRRLRWAYLDVVRIGIQQLTFPSAHGSYTNHEQDRLTSICRSFSIAVSRILLCCRMKASLNRAVPVCMAAAMSGSFYAGIPGVERGR